MFEELVQNSIVLTSIQPHLIIFAAVIGAAIFANVMSKF